MRLAGKILTITWLSATTFISPIAAAQSAKDIAGTWQLVSLDNVESGKRTPLFGEHPKGLYVFTPDNHFIYLLGNAELPKFSSNSRLTGTPEDNKAVVQGTIASFGTYTVNEADKAIIYKVESSTYPNWIGETQKRSYQVTSNELKLKSPNSSTGKGTNELVFKRVQR